MDYTKIYSQLIARARNFQRSGYTETHHIVPRCLDGQDNPENLVELTAREHFIAHRLLNKIHPKVPGLFFALYRMMYDGRDRKVTSRVYATLKAKFIVYAPSRNRTFMKSDDYRSARKQQMLDYWANPVNAHRKSANGQRLKELSSKRVTDGVNDFDSLTACAEHHEISVQVVYRRLGSTKKFAEWKYL